MLLLGNFKSILPVFSLHLFSVTITKIHSHFWSIFNYKKYIRIFLFIKIYSNTWGFRALGIL